MMEINFIDIVEYKNLCEISSSYEAEKKHLYLMYVFLEKKLSDLSDNDDHILYDDKQILKCSWNNVFRPMFDICDISFNNSSFLIREYVISKHDKYLNIVW